MITTLLSIALVSASLADDIIMPRGGGPPVRGTIARLDEDGIRLARSGVEGEDDIQFSWDRVAEVRVGGASHPRLPELLDRSEQLWRARSRLERGDAVNAEPMLEVLFPMYVGRTSETALVVAEGLLRCRLDRGELAEAIIPALETARIRRAGVDTSSYVDLVPPVEHAGGSGDVIPLYDSEYGLIPYLPPAWLEGPTMRGVTMDLETWDAGGDEQLATLADLYRRTLAKHMGESIEAVDLEDETIKEHAGALLMAGMLNAVHEEKEVRKQARDHLMASLGQANPWVETWVRFQVGRSLLMELGQGQKRRGLLYLSYLPAQWARVQPYLAGVAMAIMADQFEALDEVEAANRLRTDLRRAYPRHPVLRRSTGVHASVPEKEEQ